jgi:hypothetical protein
MARAVGHPMPATFSVKYSRGMIMQNFWRTHGLDEVNKGECGPQAKKCLQDVIMELCDLNEAAMRAQQNITIRMTKTMHQDPPHACTTLPRTLS